MQTSLSPSVCRAFLGCQIEKAVDELNLTKKIISCHPSTFAPSGPCGLQCCSSTAHTDVLQHIHLSPTCSASQRSFRCPTSRIGVRGKTSWKISSTQTHSKTYTRKLRLSGSRSRSE